MPKASRARQNLAAESTRLVQRQELQFQAGVLRAGHFNRHLGHREETRHERLRNVHALQPTQLQSALLPREYSRVDTEVAVIVEPVPGVAPGQVLPRGDQHAEQHSETNRHQQPDRPEFLDHAEREGNDDDETNRQRTDPVDQR